MASIRASRLFAMIVGGLAMHTACGQAEYDAQHQILVEFDFDGPVVRVLVSSRTDAVSAVFSGDAHE